MKKSTNFITNLLVGKGHGLKFFFLFFCVTTFSQTVSIAPSIPTASEVGPTSGEFTISVTGAGIISNLEVFLEVNVSSSATSGADYTALPASVNVLLVLGAGSATVDLDVLQDGLAEGVESVIWDITPDVSYTIDAGNPSAT
ncbi:MAG: hypothetical protein AB3N10_10555, partial [Allomuricauda sp.]